MPPVRFGGFGCLSQRLVGPGRPQMMQVVGGMTRKEFLGEPEQIHFLQPVRPVKPVEGEGE